MKTLRFYLVSLGCHKNEADLEHAATKLLAAGHRPVRKLVDADLVVINTCSFISDAEAESRAALAELAPAADEKRLTVVMGCLAQLRGKELQRDFPFVDAVLGTGAFHRLANVVERALAGARPVHLGHRDYLAKSSAKVKLTPPHYAYLRIAEGCDNRCSYCLIPDLRGPFRSRTIKHVVNEARQRIADGARELIVIAQDTTRYGEDLQPATSLSELLRQLSRLDGLVWLRLMYVRPERVTEQLLQVIAEEKKIVKYLEMPLQHSHPVILRAMGRPVLDGLALVKRIRKAVPGIALRTTLMTGFPGEGEEEFAHLADFVEQARFDHLGIFTYSPRAGTPAFELSGHLDPETKEERCQTLLQLQEDIVGEMTEKKLGEVVTVMTDSREGDHCYGRTAADAPEIDQTVRWPGRCSRGKMVSVELTETDGYGFIGRHFRG